MKPYYVVSSFGALKSQDKTPVAVVVLTGGKIANLASGQISMLGSSIQDIAVAYDLPFSMLSVTPDPHQFSPEEMLRLSTFYLRHSWDVFEVFEIDDEASLLAFARSMEVEDHAIKVIEEFKQKQVKHG